MTYTNGVKEAFGFDRQLVLLQGAVGAGQNEVELLNKFRDSNRFIDLAIKKEGVTNRG
jgi:hypothetical protein